MTQCQCSFVTTRFICCFSELKPEYLFKQEEIIANPPQLLQIIQAFKPNVFDISNLKFGKLKVSINTRSFPPLLSFVIHSKALIVIKLFIGFVRRQKKNIKKIRSFKFNYFF